MTKILLEYDVGTGAITQADGVVLIHWVDVKGFDQEVVSLVTGRDLTDKVVHLKAQGFSAGDIIQMKEAGLL